MALKANEWLVKEGHKEKVTRGRMSLAHVALLQKAYESGTRFTDWPKGTVTVTKTEDNSKDIVRVKRDASADGKTLIEPMQYRYPEEEFQAIEYRDGKRVIRSMRSACNNCRASLVVCYCPQPMIVAHDGGGSVSVTIERK